MSRQDRRRVAAARFDESHEALAGLADAPYRAARRTGNDPVSLSTIATTVGGFRTRVASAQTWLDLEHPDSGTLYAELVERVEADVKPKLAAALTPDVRVGAERTADGSFDPTQETRDAVRRWRRLSKSRSGWHRMLATRALRRSLAADSPVSYDPVMDAEVIVVGSGLVGTALTRHLAERGRSTVCVGPPAAHPPYSSHNDSGRITRVLDSNPIWAELARRSIEAYGSLEQRSRVRFHHPVGVLWSAASTAGLRSLDAARDEFAVPIDDGLGGWAGALALDAAGTVLELGGAGYVEPLAMASAHRSIAVTFGARFRPGVVVALEPVSGGWSVALRDGSELRSLQVVVAAGTGTGSLVDVPIEVTAEAVVHAGVSAADGERLSRLPCVGQLTESGSRVDGYFTPPTQDSTGWSIKFGAESDERHVLATPQSVSRWMETVDLPESKATLEAGLRAMLPDVKFGAIRAVPCMYARTPTHLPIIDEIEPGLFVGGGGNGRMAKSADAVASLVAGLVVSGEWNDPLDHALFQGRIG